MAETEITQGADWARICDETKTLMSAVKDKAAKPNKPIPDGVDWKSVVEKLRDLASDIEDAAAKDTAPGYSNMRFALRAVNVLVKDLRDRKPKVDDYTANGLLNIEKWAEFGLDPNGEQLVREWAETASNPKGEEFEN